MSRRTTRAVLFGLLGAGACGEEPLVEPPVPAAIVITASDTLTAPGHGLTFTAVVVDNEGQAIASDPVTWSVSDTMRGRIAADGAFTGGPWVGRVHVRAALAEAALAESLAVRIVPPGTPKWTWAAAAIGDPGAHFPTVGGPALGADGTIYVLARRSAVNYQAVLVALTPGGTPKWTLDLDSVGANYPMVTPAGDIVVVAKPVYVVTPDGDLRWQVRSDAEIPTFKAGAVTADLVVAALGFRVLALRLATGDTLWQSSRSTLSEWLVPPTVVGNDLVYAKHAEDTLFAFRQSDGAILKTFLDPDTAVDKAVFGAGTVPVGDRLYLPTVSRLAAFDTAGPLLWLTDRNDKGTPEPAVGPDGTVYVQNGRWGLQAINTDGTTRWYRRHVASPQGRWWEEPRWTWYGGPALAEGGIIYGAGWNRFFAYDVDGNPLWQYQTDSAGVAQAFTGSPAIGPDGIVYTYTATHVYAFWGSAPPEPNSPWPMWRHDAQRTGWVR